MGDVHGNKAMLRHLEPYAVQLGDFDLRGYSRYDHLFEGGPRFMIDGNHDHFPSLAPFGSRPRQIARNLYHIPRGTVCGEVLFLGGGDTPDWDPKKQTMVGWYPEETIRRGQVDALTGRKVEVVVSHDCPSIVLDSVLAARGVPPEERGSPYPSSVNLSILFESLRPKLWVFGHHHVHFAETVEGCFFLGLDIGQIATVEVPADLGELVP